MQKILVTSLRSEFDLISSSKLIAGIHRDHPHAEIHLLTLSTFSETAEIINHVSKVHLISIEKIQQIFSGAIYHQGYGINLFIQELQFCINTHWHLVINHSNDDVSAYLISALNATTVLGTSITMDGTPQTSNIFNEYLNYISPQLSRNPVMLSEIKMHMCSSVAMSEDQPIKIQTEHFKVASQNFEKIKNMKAAQSTIIVAISIAQDAEGEFLDYNSCVQIIEELEESDKFKAVLLLDNTPEQKYIVNQLNTKFNNKIISICSQTEAIPGILANVDILISNHNLHLYIADLMKIKCIEVTNNLKTQRLSSNESYSIVAANDSIYNEVNYILNIIHSTALPVESAVLANAVYRVESDKNGIFFTQIQGPINIVSELTYHLTRIYSYELLTNNRDDQFLTALSKHCSNEDVNKFIAKTRMDITNCSKHLLATLRTLKGVKNSKENRFSFIKHLDSLIATANDNNLTLIPILLFESEVKSIENTDIEQSLLDTEACLYTLKNNFQKLTGCLEILAKQVVSGQPHEAIQNV